MTIRKPEEGSIAFGVAVFFGMAKVPSLAIETGYASRLPEAVQTLKAGVQLVGYRHGGEYCQYRECVSYIPAATTRSAAAATNITITRPKAAVVATTISGTTMAAAGIRAAVR